MKTKHLISYEELAWTESVISTPGLYPETAQTYRDIITRYTDGRRLLHLGCGAGIDDFHFKEHFSVTGVDISRGMLEEAEKLNPEVRYLLGDMRSIDLHETFDAVIIPDSIGYMVSEEDLRKAVGTACRHLAPCGVFIVTAHTREEFRNNNFVYSAASDDLEITIFENNWISTSDTSTYEATIVYLIRRQGILETFIDVHTLGLFPRLLWHSIFNYHGLAAEEYRLDHLYDQYLQDQGEYPMTVFSCRRHH